MRAIIKTVFLLLIVASMLSTSIVMAQSEEEETGTVSTIIVKMGRVFAYFPGAVKGKTYEIARGNAPICRVKIVKTFESGDAIGEIIPRGDSDLVEKGDIIQPIREYKPTETTDEETAERQEVRILEEGQIYFSGAGAQWMSDGYRIVFYEPGKTTEFGVQQPTIYTFSILTGQPRVLTTGRSPLVSPDESGIVFIRDYEDKDGEGLFYISLETELVRELPLSGIIGPYRSISWAPDSKTIAFTVEESRASVNSFIFNLEKNRLESLNANCRELDYSPKGDLLAVSNNTGIHLMMIEDNSILPLVSGKYGNPKWSPDGARIVFEGSDGVSGIFVVDIDSRIPIKKSLFGSNPNWSNNGKMISFLRDNMGVYIVNISGRSEPLLIAEKHVFATKDNYTQWAPNDGKIIYSIKDNGIWAVDVPK